MTLEYFLQVKFLPSRLRALETFDFRQFLVFIVFSTANNGAGDGEYKYCGRKKLNMFLPLTFVRLISSSRHQGWRRRGKWRGSQDMFQFLLMSVVSLNIVPGPASENYHQSESRASQEQRKEFLQLCLIFSTSSDTDPGWWHEKLQISTEFHFWHVKILTLIGFLKLFSEDGPPLLLPPNFSFWTFYFSPPPWPQSQGGISCLSPPEPPQRDLLHWQIFHPSGWPPPVTRANVRVVFVARGTKLQTWKLWGRRRIFNG